jgi:hypothetical protein
MSGQTRTETDGNRQRQTEQRIHTYDNLIGSTSRVEELHELLQPTLHHLGFADAWAEGHIGKCLLALLHLEQFVLDAVLNDELDGRHWASLSESMLQGKVSLLDKKPMETRGDTYHSIDSLMLNSRVPVRVHEVHPRCGRQVQADTTRLETDEKHFTMSVVLETFHGGDTFFTAHGTIKTLVANVGQLECILDLVEHRRPLGTITHMSAFSSQRCNR